MNDTFANEQNAYGRLSDHFNDWDKEYQNQAIAYEDVNGVPVAKSPFEPSSIAWTCIAGQTYELNPQCPNNRYVRNGAWIKTQVTMIKRILTILYSNFMKSGKQDGSDETAESDWKDEVNCKEWLCFAGNADKFRDCMIYSFVLFEQDDFINFGKSLPPKVGRDLESNLDPKIVNKESEEVRVKRKREQKGKGDSTGSSAGGGLLATIKELAKMENKTAALKFFATDANTCHSVKERAVGKLMAMAFDDSD